MKKRKTDREKSRKKERSREMVHIAALGFVSFLADR